MKAIRLTDQRGPNPGYSKAAAAEAKAKNEPYDVPKEVTYPAGSICDHPQSWIHCCRAQPIMRPADKECEDKVYAYLNHPARLAQLARLKGMAQPAVFKTLPKGLQDYVRQMAVKWLPDSELAQESEPEGDTEMVLDTESEPVDSETLGFFE